MGEPAAVARRLRAMGIRDKPIASGSPWQNGFTERLIGSIRRECVDHVIVLGEAHLRRTLTKYAAYYNELRTHRSLGKDAPIHRAIQYVGRMHRGRSSADFVAIIVESSFRYRQPSARQYVTARKMKMAGRRGRPGDFLCQRFLHPLRGERRMAQACPGELGDGPRNCRRD